MKHKFLTLTWAIAMACAPQITKAETMKIAHGMGGHWGTGCAYCTGFDTKNVTTITGTIEDIATFTPMKGVGSGVHLKLNTGKETVAIHLGPSWYLDNQEIKFQKKDRIEVKGFRANWNDDKVVIASEARKGDQVLLLRDADGRPAWSGWHHEQK